MKTIFETKEGLKLFQNGLSLYEKTERKNTRSASVNGIEVGYLEFGSRDGIPLIWAHGSGMTSYEMVNVQAGLVEAGYWVLAIDYRGHGKTQVNINQYNTSLYHVADDIAALLDYLNISKAIVGGLSKGGRVATAFFDAYPQRVLGLLLEDGGSWSSVRLEDDIRLKLVKPGPFPYPIADMERLYDPSLRFQSRLEGLKAVWSVYSPSVKNNLTKAYIALMLSCLRQQKDGSWIHHCDAWRLFYGASERLLGGPSDDKTLYSRLPLMQQSQELMIPLVVFRKLNVPVHIIDPVCPDDWLPVRHLNEKLQALHPDWIEHEVYEYEHSPHEAHLQRPERFIASAKALLKRVQEFV